MNDVDRWESRKAQERTYEQEQQRQLEGLVASIAQAMPDWEMKVGDGEVFSRRHIALHNGTACIGIRRMTYPTSKAGRIEVSGRTNDLRRHVNYDDRETKISFTFAKTVEAKTVVNRIRKQLLPVYLPIMERAQANRLKFENAKENALREAHALALEFGGSVGDRISDDTTAIVRLYPLSDVILYGDGKGRISQETRTISVEKIRRILTILAE